MRFARGMVFGMTLAIGILKADPVCAENQGKLPEIASWQNGFGYQEDGTQITGGWAYDMVNPAGRYVQFGEDGSVIQKTENPDTMDMGENYTGTELVPATLAIRAELFDGFSGTVTILPQFHGSLDSQDRKGKDGDHRHPPSGLRKAGGQGFCHEGRRAG